MKHTGWAACAALAVALAAAPAPAQSLLANRGLGLVVEPADARSHALGGVRLGLAGNFFSWANPAEVVGVPAPGLTVAYQFDDFSAEFGGRSVDGSTARFPLILGAIPISERWAVMAGIGGFLDQNFAVERTDTLLIGTDSLVVLDRFSSEGGAVRLRLGTGYRVAESLSVGLGVDFYAGGVERAFGRRFPGELTPGCCSTEWTYSGVGALAGVDWRPGEAVRVGLAASYGGTLEAETDDLASAGAEFDLPVVLRAGASGRVANELLLALSGQWAGWSSLDGALAAVGGAEDSWEVGGGAEYEGLRIRDRAIPLRLGARYGTLPFGWEPAADLADAPTERAITSGLGLVLAGGAARADLALERGWRGGEGTGLEEDFWRTVLSVTVLGR